MSSNTSLDRPADWARLLSALADCVREPDTALYEGIEDGHLVATIDDLTGDLSLRPATGISPPVVDSLGEMTESYLRLFEAMATPYAPIAESPYRPWYGDRTGLMGGPPAEDMTRRYDAIDATFPEDYPPDHLALELEYGSVLLEVGADEAFSRFAVEHLDWIPAVREATDGAAAAAPFQSWAIHLIDDVTVTLRDRLDVPPVDQSAIDAMVDRLGTHAARPSG